MELLLTELLLAHSGDLATLLAYLNELFDPATVESIITEDLHSF